MDGFRYCFLWGKSGLYVLTITRLAQWGRRNSAEEDFSKFRYGIVIDNNGR